LVGWLVGWLVGCVSSSSTPQKLIQTDDGCLTFFRIFGKYDHSTTNKFKMKLLYDHILHLLAITILWFPEVCFL
jgi:hypothetical protein